METKKIFINDNGSTVEERNMNLSAMIALAPNVHRRITKIERDQVSESGFWLFYLEDGQA